MQDMGSVDSLQDIHAVGGDCCCWELNLILPVIFVLKTLSSFYVSSALQVRFYHGSKHSEP